MFIVGTDTPLSTTCSCVSSLTPFANDATATCANDTTSSCTNDATASCANDATATCANDATATCANDATATCANDAIASCTNDATAACANDATSSCSPHKLILISNNPQWLQIPSLENYLTFQYMETQALDVLMAARDRIHTGWQLLNHPLYGNFRPYQQPFRSMLAQPSKERSTDTLSLHLIEQALNIYHDCAHQILDIAKLHPNLLRDCAYLDRALLDATLEHCCHCSFLTSTSYKE